MGRRHCQEEGVTVEARSDALYHPRPGEGKVILAGTADDDVVQDSDAHVLQGLRDLVGGVDVLFGRVTLLSGVRSCRHETELHEHVQPRFLYH